ncbi:hypothetical protein PVAND_004349 [Polypedilum vanderplanki]|uniref:Uncharacterized protein n=1 Tax=Polypedilum vanderplanki TaxID=319348 RepID=A0A9J6BWV9_POLVA|nr:hypothetical protein PVAND_004349 [Polypedilum vanderplanki]
MEKNRYEEQIAAMIRIEETGGTKQGEKMVRGTVLVEDEEIIRTSLDSTTTFSLIRNTIDMKELCDHFTREQNPGDKVNFIRVDYKDNVRKDLCQQIMMCFEDNLKGIVIQDYVIRDLRIRPNEGKEAKDYKHFQQNVFFPSLDKLSS